ncbi:MAG: hypothetical protein ACO1NX_04290 [Chitinophagaceae bacterium]
MQIKTFFSNWTKVAALLLMVGALAWIIKLGVIVSTKGEVIDTGIAALLMKVGIITLTLGSTGIGSRLSLNRALWLRVIAILLSPVLLFACFLAAGFIAGPLFKNINLWYAEQEAPIALAVVVSSIIGITLYRNYKPDIQ